MSFEWIHENPPRWDEPKARIVGAAPEGVFVNLSGCRAGDLLPGEWWRAEEAGAVLGYGWLDCGWGEAEILLAVDPQRQGSGVGTWILDRLEQEAAACGLNYMYNVVRQSHPDREGLVAWLRRRQFEPAHDDERWQRRVR